MKDGVNASIRYYKNNFADGFRQVSDVRFLNISLAQEIFNSMDFIFIFKLLFFLGLVLVIDNVKHLSRHAFQDAIDLFLGNYVVDPNEGISKPSPLETHRDWRFMAVSSILCILLYVKSF